MRADWRGLKEAVQGCDKCILCRERKHVVLGEGNVNAPIMLVGEGPGKDEDEQGRPFVGPSGQLLDRMLASISLDRKDVYICNVVKCRPPGNRVPTDLECETCKEYLRAQFVLIKPKIIVCLGRTAARQVYDPNVSITRDRGVWKLKKGTWMLATYHPAALLRDASKKHESWEDLQLLRDKLSEIQG